MINGDFCFREYYSIDQIIMRGHPIVQSGSRTFCIVGPSAKWVAKGNPISIMSTPFFLNPE
jgi:hypothetical protein